MPLFPANAGGTKNNIYKRLLLLTKSRGPFGSGAGGSFRSGSRARSDQERRRLRRSGSRRRKDERRKLDGPIWPIIQKRTQERTQSRAGGHPLGLCPKPHAGALPPRPRRRKAPAGPIASVTALLSESTARRALPAYRPALMRGLTP